MGQSEISEVKVFAPATVANLGCGYDVMGLAIEGPGDELHLRRTRSGGFRIKTITGDEGRLPLAPEKNSASLAALAVLKELGISGHFELEIHKKMPFGSGLGSSAASAVAGAFAMNELLGSPLERPDLVPAAMVGESYVSGAWHADNVAAGMLGGICLVRENDPLELLPLPVPNDLWVLVVYDSNLEILTSQARDLLPRTIETSLATQQAANLGGFISALYENNYRRLARCVKDLIAEPHRRDLIPPYQSYRDLALGAGALCFGISGSGPSLFALCHGELSAYRVADAFQTTGATLYHSKINGQGVTLL